MGSFIIPFLVAVAISYISTPMVRKLAIKIGAVDVPKDDRRVHTQAMPFLGGIAIFASFVITVLLFLPLDRSTFAILIGATVIVISGILDDLRDLSPKAKLLFQISAAIILVLGGIKIEFITNPFSSTSTLVMIGWLSIPITIFWIVGITNTVNLIDGLDGLAAGVAMISSISLMLVAYKFSYTEITILAAIVAGGCLGFLPFNFNPAKIFMGDTGALFLGFILAAISIEGIMKSVATIAVVVPIIILGIPIFDTTFAIFRRLLNGQSIMAADKGHLHHRLLNMGFSQKKTVLILYGISSIFGLTAVLISKANSRQAVYLSMITFVAAILVAIKIGLFETKE